ncbi:DUF723 domain-containing protein [Vibrio parahaemolyticus]|uniref:DUF723 domain-containing protein n=1 Tax=Vibrio parahaemolyticus TaxID=670 RepID=UPI0011228B7E|nr:DUF723 domain-containing protein [Vibrio parahaemolyticus]TOG90752.1 hypothetical protein CGI92_21600 [Vibrio parahaemolyticus]
MLKPSQQEREQRFIQRAKQKYAEPYDYSEVKYVNQTTQVKVICPKHGAFHTSPKNFLAALKKIGCPSCSRSQGARRRPQKASDGNEASGCGTDNFNVRRGTKKHQSLLLKVFG